jgi:hypothetical protein
LLYDYYSELKDINELYDNISRLEDEFLEANPQLPVGLDSAEK